MDITHKQVRAAYEFLRQCPPFCDWGLPPTEAVRFGTFRSRRFQGDYDHLRGRVRVSHNRVATADRLMVCVAHEMAHMAQELMGDSGAHNTMFAAMTSEICEQLGFDPKEF